VVRVLVDPEMPENELRIRDERSGSEVRVTNIGPERDTYTKAEVDAKLKALGDLSELLMKWFQEDDERVARAESLCRKGMKLEERQWRNALLDALDDIFSSIRKSQREPGTGWSYSLNRLRERFLR
jgi:hypothetical protein